MHFLLHIVLLALMPTQAWAAETLSMGSPLLRMSWALLLVMGLILAIYGIAKKRLSLGTLGGKAIKVIEIRPIMPKSTLALVEVHGKEYLLGIGADGIRLLADVSGNAQEEKPNFETLMRDGQ